MILPSGCLLLDKMASYFGGRVVGKQLCRLKTLIGTRPRRGQRHCARKEAVFFVGNVCSIEPDEDICLLQ